MSRPIHWARRVLHAAGLDVVRWRPPEPEKLPPDFDEATRSIVERVRPFTMTSAERIHEVISAVRHVARHGIEGAVVECGAWRGGSMMAAALALLATGRADRELWLFDTFEGMPEPGARDVSLEGVAASETWREKGGGARGSEWCRASVDDVRANLLSTGYDASLVRLVQGKVEDTLPAKAPERIALLRLDTDWEASTRHELEHLFPRLAPGGILIVDDYGHWRGARQAVDEYLERTGTRLFLARTDYTGRIGVKER